MRVIFLLMLLTSCTTWETTTPDFKSLSRLEDSKYYSISIGDSYYKISKTLGAPDREWKEDGYICSFYKMENSPDAQFCADIKMMIVRSKHRFIDEYNLIWLSRGR